ncbi:MAG: host attachment protein [Gammaproteobacteria bacterium]|jgi:protein required for attachment to host cells
MSITWVVVADKTVAKIFVLGQIKGELVFLKEIDNPEGRLKAGEIGYDKPGQLDNPMHGNSKTFERANPKEVELDRFAHHIADVIETGRVNHSFNRLVLIMGPHFHGTLAKALNPHVIDMVHKIIHKEYTHMPTAELYQHVIELD